MPELAPVSRIVTHPGSAHKDDLLACALVLALYSVPIERRDPTQEDLADAAAAVIDVGGRWEPELNNFDHHQFPRQSPPTCSLSLVLKVLGRYEAALKFCPWMEPAEWFDCRGANATARFLKVPREAISQLNSPIDVTLLRRFAGLSRVSPGEPLHEILKMIGEDLLAYIDGLQKKLAYIGRHSRLWEIETREGVRSVLFLPRIDPLPPEPSAGLSHYVEEAGLAELVIGYVYPDRRGEGYGLSRYNDHALLDFNRVEEEEDVHFVHKQGFVAKTTASSEDRLRALVEKALT